VIPTDAECLDADQSNHIKEQIDAIAGVLASETRMARRKL
jgi:hypothetical protein